MMGLTNSLFLGLALLISLTSNAQFWMQSNNENSAYELTFTDDGSIYHLASNNTLLKSEDDGNLNSWMPVVGFPNENQYRIFTRNNDVFLTNHGAQNSFNGRGVFLSSDGGQTWSQKNNGLASDTNVVNMFGLSDNVLLIYTKPDQATQNLYRSTNNGDTWEFVQSVEGHPTSVTVTSNNEWFLCSRSHLYKSTDNGLNWSEVNSNSTTGYYHITELDNGDLLLMALFELLESSDGGITFTTKSTTGLPDLSTNSNILYAHGEFYDEVIYLSINNGHGIFKSVDQGVTWTNIDFNLPGNQIFPEQFGLNKNGYLFTAVTGEGVYRSTSPVATSVVNLTQNTPEELDIQLFPNPVEDVITVSLGDSNAKFSIEVTNIQGELIYVNQDKTASEIQFTLEGDPGIYLFNIYNEEYNYTGRIVKK